MFASSCADQVYSTSGVNYDTDVVLPQSYYEHIGVADKLAKVLKLAHHPEVHWLSCRLQQRFEEAETQSQVPCCTAHIPRSFEYAEPRP